MAAPYRPEPPTSSPLYPLAPGPRFHTPGGIPHPGVAVHRTATLSFFADCKDFAEVVKL